MASMPRGEPRTSTDGLDAEYDEMLRQHQKDLSARLMEALAKGRPARDPSRPSIGHPGAIEVVTPAGIAREAIATLQDLPEVGHPGFIEWLVPVWGSGREAVADLQDGDYLGAALNAGMAATDVVPVKAAGGVIVKGAGKGVAKLAAGASAKQAASTAFKSMIKTGSSTWGATRKWALRNGHVDPYEILHHWLIPQGSPLGKAFPQLANQLWNLKRIPEVAKHTRIHTRFKGLPRFGPIERYLEGTPAWWKGSNATTVGKPVGAAKRQWDERRVAQSPHSR